MSKTLYCFVLIIVFSLPAFAKTSWQYKSFPFVNKNFPAKIKEPSALITGKNVLHPIMSKESGTHLFWGVEQVFTSKDLKKTVFVKYNVALSSQSPIGGWTRLSQGHVLHLKIANSIVAIFAKGMNNMELYEIQKQFSQSKATALRLFNPFMECSFADEVVGGVEQKDTVVSDGDPKASDASYLKRVGNVMKCLKDETVDATIATGKRVWENATFENIKDGAKNSALALWDSVPSWEETKAGAKAGWEATKTGVTATGQFIKDTYNDPDKAMSDIYDKYQKTKEVVAMFGTEILNKVSGVASLAADMQDLFICHSLKEFAKEGALHAALLALTGAGVAVAVAKIALIVGKYALKIGPVVKALQVVNASAHLGKEKIMELAKKVLRGEMDPKELEALQAKAAAQKGIDEAALKAENDKLRTAAAGDKQAMLDKAGAMSPSERLRAAEETIGRELKPEEKVAIMKAHDYAGGKTYSQLTPADLREKRQILKDAGFTDAQANAMMRKGITGRGDRDYTILPDNPGIEDYRLRAEALSYANSPEALSATRTAVAKYDRALKDEAAGYRENNMHYVRKSNASDLAAALVKMEKDPERVRAARETYGRMQMATMEEDFAKRRITYAGDVRGEVYEELVYMMNEPKYFNRNHAEALIEQFNTTYRNRNGWVPLNINDFRGFR